MLIDFISVDRLPWVVVWLDWNFYAYWNSFTLIALIFQIHYLYSIYHMPGAIYGVSGSLLAIFVGFCAWVSWCALRYGYAVG